MIIVFLYSVNSTKIIVLLTRMAIICITLVVNLLSGSNLLQDRLNILNLYLLTIKSSLEYNKY